MRISGSLRDLAFVFAITMLSGCGGSNSGGNDANKELVGGSGLSVNVSDVSLVLDRNGPKSNTTMKVSWTSFSVTRVSVSTPPGVATPSWLSHSLIGSSSPITLSIGLNTTNVPVGVYQTTVRVVSYKGNTSMDYVDIPVHIEVLQRPQASPAELTFSMVEGQIPQSQTITFSRPGEALSIYDSSFLYGQPVWGGYSINGNLVTVAITDGVNSIAPGAYSSSMEVDYNGGRWSIPINLTVEAALNVPDSVAFDITQASTAADKTQDIPVASNSGAAVNWEVTSDQPWMSVTPATGNTQSADHFSVSLVQAELDTMRNGNYRGMLTVSSADPGVSPKTIPVTLNLTLPQASYVAPYQAVSGVADEVVIRGFGFNSLTGATVSFGGSAATAATVLSDTEIRATHGPLTAGDYAVQVSGTNYSVRSFATLKVSDTQTYAPVWNSGTVLGVVDNLFFDSSRKAVFFRNQSNFTGSVIKYQFNGIDWVLSAAANASIKYGGVALTPDGSFFYAHAISKAVTVNSDDLTVDVLLDSNSALNNSFKSAAFANNGMMLLTESAANWSRIYVYDMATNDPTNLTALFTSSADNADRIAKASLDGSRVYFVDQSTSSPVMYYDASTGQLQTGTLSIQASAVSVDKSANRLIIGNGVYDSNLNLLGSLPSTILASVITGDSSTAYTFESDGNGVVFRKFDLTTPDGMGGFLEVGAGITLAGSQVVNPQMTISPDDATLFVVGQSDFMVQPVPTN